MDGTELWLPPDLPYPITISSLALDPSSHVSRGTRLLTYSFTFKSAATGSSETRFGTWDSTTDGTLHEWKVNRGDIISQSRAVVVINETCKHSVQIGGLCAVCGKDITESDYMGSSYASRATIQMTHSGKGPTVSLEEAQQLERETAAHLLRQRKLSLIVDLDQTIVHATVDPTVGEWILEGEAWEARQGAKAEGSSAPAADEDDPVNPNWEALKDVAKFVLGPEAVGRSNAAPKFSIPGCMYYIKPRPGLQDFLRKINEKYEMHVYTMGTRAYAEAVCAAIDRGGTFFRDRILSRDESGSFTQKSLQRLFPCDQSMVVIIDDRADVWEWSPNLLKVRPYDFFVGIGDINSTPVSKAPSTVASAVLAAQNKITSERIAAQVEDRPLAKKQELLEEEEQKEEDTKTTVVNGAKQKSGHEKHEKHNVHHRKALLKNDDTELTRLASLLEEIHKRFYDAYDVRLPGSVHLSDEPPSKEVAYDVRTIIPRIRAETSHDLPAPRKRQDGASHLVASEAPVVKPSSASMSPQIHITPPDEEEEELVEDPNIEVDLDADVWADANAEVDEVLGEETEDDDLGSNFPEDEAGGDDSGWRSDASNASTFSVAKRGKKRSRSSSVSISTNETKALPLPKRTKLLESRRTVDISSRLKPNNPSDQVDGGEAGSREESSNDVGEDETAAVATADVDESEGKSRDNESTTSTDGDNAVDEFDYDDDFLARELEQEPEQEQEAGG